MFNNEAALIAVEFIRCLRHADGKFYGQPFELLPWQHSVVSEFYGTLRPDNLRQYQYLYLEIPKKNGKSELAAALALYHAYADGEKNGEVYVVAADKENASIVFNVAVEMINQCPALKKQTKFNLSTRTLTDKGSGTRIKVMSSEAYSKHGYKPSCVIFDELHAQPNRDLWDIMTFGAGSARAQPVWIVLTTAGDDPDRKSIGWEVHEYARNVLMYRTGELDGINDPVWLPFIYGADEDADIWNEETWYKANPSLGYTIDIETVRQEALGARNSEARERLFRWLRLNQWIALKRYSWMPLTLFDQTTGSWSAAELVGKHCYIGLDLSSTTDLTAAALVFPPQEGVPDWRLLYEAWIPEDSMREREARDHVPFSDWVKHKYLIATPGNVVDYEFVEARIMEFTRIYDVRQVCTDPWNSRMLTQRLMKANVEVIEISQDMRGMSPAMKETQRLLLAGLMSHEKHPVARWCFGNTKIAIDGNENMKPMKNKSTERIDIMVAWINGMARAIFDTEKKSIYDSRGLLVL